MEAGSQVKRLLQSSQWETGGSDQGGARTMGRERRHISEEELKIC